MPTPHARRWKWLALRPVLAYCIVAMVLNGCADYFILHPSVQPIVIPGAQRIEVPSPSGPVEVWTLRSAGAAHLKPMAFVIEFVGNASRAEELLEYTARQWGPRPVEVWAINYPGFGGSGGAAKLKSIPPAALCVYDALRVRAGDRPIFISGHSIGTTAALYLSAHRPVAGVVLQNPPPLRQLILGKFGWWNLWLAAGPIALGVPSDLDSLANARQCSAPATFLLAGADTFVEPKYQQQVANAYAGPKRAILMPLADHNSPLSDKASKELQVDLDWMWSTVSSPAPAASPHSSADTSRPAPSE